MNDSDHWPIMDDEENELPRRYLLTVAIEAGFCFKVEAENQALAIEEALARIKKAQYQLAGAEVTLVEIRGCSAIAL